MTALPCEKTATSKHLDRFGDVRLWHDDDHSDAHVESCLDIRLRDVAHLLDEGEDRSRSPCRPVNSRDEVVGKDAGEVVGQSPTCDVAHRVHLDLTDEGQQVGCIDGGGLQQFLAEGASQFVDVTIKGPTGVGQQHLADQRVAVGVQPRGGHRQQDVTLLDPLRAEDLVVLDGPGGGTCDVVLLGGQQAGMLGRLAAEQ